MTGDRKTAYLQVESLATWSPWIEFTAASAKTAPRLPGVYLIRVAATLDIVYVGSAGERAGGRIPLGIAGRLGVYWSGKGAVSGFGEAAFDRALADPTWVEARLALLRSAGPARAKEWALAAMARVPWEVRWTTTGDKTEAIALERLAETYLRPHEIWNR